MLSDTEVNIFADMKRLITHFLITSVLCLVPVDAFSQLIWEKVGISHVKWETHCDFKTYSNSWANLDFWNYCPQSEISQKYGKWSDAKYYAKLDINEKYGWRLSFTICNKHNLHDHKYNVINERGKEEWHKGPVDWGYEIEIEDNIGISKYYKKYFSNLKEANSSMTFTSTWDSVNQKWEGARDTYIRRITIEYDGAGKLTINNNDEVIHSHKGVKRIRAINICAGSAARINVSSLNLERKSLYAEAKPYITSGMSKLESNDFWGAIEDYTKVIDIGYRSHDIYFKRGYSYYSIKFYNNAIEDFTNSLSLKKTEDAYLYRGLSKLAKKDMSAIDDLKNGGPKGIAILKELEIDGTAPPEDDGSSQHTSSGTGFFIDPNGYIATNHHVIDGAKDIDVFVTQKGMTAIYKARIVIADKATDLAIIKITDENFSRIPPILYGISEKTRDVGTDVFTMGYPQLSYLGDEIKVTNGIINSKTGYQGGK